MREITNVLLFAFKTVYYFASSVQLMTWILLHALAFHPLERLRWSLAWISSLPMGLSPSYLFGWQLMWWVTTDVAVSVCGHSSLWPFRFVAVPFCGRFGLWPFRFVAVSVCGRSGLWPFRFVAVPVCGRFGLWPFRFVAVSVVAISVCGRYDLLLKRFPCYRYFQDGLYRSTGDSLHKGPVMRNFMFLFRSTWTDSWFRAFLYDMKICACVCASVG